MGKYMGNIEELIDVNATSDPNLQPLRQREESEYWIHRTHIPQLLYFNTNFANNELPLIMSQIEMEEELLNGKEIIGNIEISSFYDDDDLRIKILKKLEEKGLTQEDFEHQLRDKVSLIFKSFFEKGLYLLTAYGRDLQRTAHQLSPEKMRKIIEKENFGFNYYRGLWNAAIILQIPIDEQDKIFEKLPETIEYRTEYYHTGKVSQVVSPKYIKGVIAKFGTGTMFIKNEGFVKRKETKQITKISEKEMFLYHIEQLFKMALQKYYKSELPDYKKAEDYTKMVSFIESQFRKYSRQTKGFPCSEKYKEVCLFLKNAMLFRPFEPDKTKGNFINMVKSKAYYQSIAEQLNKYIKETNFIGPGDDEDIGFPR